MENLKTFSKQVNNNCKRKHFKFSCKNLTKFPQIEIDNQATATKYRQLHAKIEQMCRFFNITLVQITVPMFVLPVLFVTIFNYFILDLGDESFYLSSPISYVIVNFIQ